VDIASWVLQATALFIVTNIDDIIVLSLFYARGAGRRGTTRAILVGQYLGFGAILAAAVLVALGARKALPEEALPYFGLIPLTLGSLVAWRSWRHPADAGDDEDDDDDTDYGRMSGPAVSSLAVATVTFANGGDNIGVYTPVFAAVGTAGTVAYSCVFLALVGMLVATARFVATRGLIAEILERWEKVLFPTVLIGLGLVILVEGGAFGL
jgi:cadmium resistance protein CadD (predicted permease)